MKLIQLEYLLTVAREGSFSRAAAAHMITQPAISQQIKTLEVELGTLLFHRTQSGAKMTTAGHILGVHAERVLERIELARSDVLSNSSEVAGDVTLEVTNAMVERLVPPLVNKLNRQFPLIALNVKPLPSHQVQLNIENGRVDLGVLPDLERLTKVNAKTLSEEPLHFLCSPDHEAAKQGNQPISLEEALIYPMVSTHKDQPFRQFLESKIREHQLSTNVIYETNELLMIFSHVTSGLACAILPNCAIHEKGKHGVIVARRIVKPDISQPYLVAWPKSLPLNAASKTVRDIIIQLSQNR